MTPAEISVVLSAMRETLVASLANIEAQIGQVDAVIRLLNPAVAVPKCPACGSERLVDLAKHGDAGSFVCDVCTHSFSINPS